MKCTEDRLYERIVRCKKNHKITETNAEMLVFTAECFDLFKRLMKAMSKVPHDE